MEFRVYDLGLVDFQSASQTQKRIFNDVKNNCFNAALIICSHYPVITMGRRASKEHIKVTLPELKKCAIALYETDRGGDVTYHGPGQLTVYPIINLNYFKKDIHLFLRTLEKLVMDFLSDFGIKALRYNGLTGVWVEKQKIASIGIAIRNWITFHGMSINIKKTDLDNFRLIKPCGMNIEMTSMESELDTNIEIVDVKSTFIDRFKYSFEEGREAILK